MSDKTSENSIVERLFGSFKVLEQAIISARETLYTRKGVSPEVLSRLDSYSELLEKQKKLATELQLLIDNAQWIEVAQKISIINGLLEMIRNDAKEILDLLNGNNSYDELDVDNKPLIC
jgi:hypothetical protein